MNQLIEIIEKFNKIHNYHFMIIISKNFEREEDIVGYNQLIEGIYKDYNVSNCDELVKLIELIYRNVDIEKNQELCKNVVHALNQADDYNLGYSNTIFLKMYSDIISNKLYNPNWAVGYSSEPLFTMLPIQKELLDQNLTIFETDSVDWEILRNEMDATESFIHRYMNTEDMTLKKYYLEIIKNSITSKWDKNSTIRYRDQQKKFHYKVDKTSERVKKLYNIKLNDFLQY